MKGEEMLTITIKVNAPGHSAFGIKESLAMFLERFGDAKVVSIKDDASQEKSEQMGFFGANAPQPTQRRANR